MIQRTTHSGITLASATVVVALVGCGQENPLAPPDIVYGDDICAVCGMIISDERFATAVVYDDETELPPLSFDDIGCMWANDTKRPGHNPAARFVHDYDSVTWINAEEAVYFHSSELHTPMGFGVAACGDRGAAELLTQRFDGDLLDYAAIAARFTANASGFDKASDDGSS